ncbi:hypothetical protein PHET_04061 [Paragonimus heterotremus]|uniref:Histone acetyltransferase n=1 Tax=Paragonimus heterotremus TaxID=100268 RepID=A0A8J4SQN0_9TREM|nr:hypothetical protein PHET_04061 [Paragonimus heterotremus]
MQNYSPFHLPSMLAATANGGPTTYVAINGMLSTTPTGHHVANPGSMLTMPSGLTPSGLLPGSNMGPNPFLFPSTTFPHLPGPNLACAAGPFSSSPFHAPLLPFFTSTAAGVLAGNPPISAPSPFSAPLPQQLLQPQHTGPSLNTYPSAVSVTSVMGQLGSQPHLLSDPNQVTITTISPSLLPNALPQHSMLLSTPSLNIGSSLASNSNDILTYAPPSVSCVSTSGTNIPIISTYSANTVASSAGSMHTTLSSPIQPPVSPPSMSQSSSPPGSSGSGPTCINSSLQGSLKLDKFQPVVSSGTLGHKSTHPTTLLSLESVDFHRDEILDAIDKLRERKARPDFERISCMLKRHRNINPEQTQLCLGKLAAAGAVVCVDYKGNLSYRNPSKWRKTAVTSGVTNPASISQRLIEALRRLMAGTVYQPNCVPGSEHTFASLLPAPPGPNGGYSLFQIERALQVVDSSIPKTTTTGGLSSKPLPELTGATLRVCLDREAVHGKLAKTPDGRYVLDESGERKRLASLAALSNKKPLPPHSLSSNFLSTPGSHSKYVKLSGSVAPIAPAGEQATRPLAAKQPQPGAVSIAPVGSRTISPSPLFNLPPRPSGVSRRGRPPGSKSRRCLPSADCVTLSEKKLKLETTTGSFSTDSASRTHSIPTSPFGQNTTVANPATLKANVPHPVISVSQNGFCSSNSFIGLTPVNGVCPTVLPTPILPSSFPVSQAPDATLSHAFNSPFFTFSTCPTPVVSCPNGFQHPGMLTNLPATMPCDFSVLSKQDSTHESTLITVLPNLDPMTWNHQMTEEKCEKEAEDLCYHCGTQAVKDEPFLICKDCNLHDPCLLFCNLNTALLCNGCDEHLTCNKSTFPFHVLYLFKSFRLLFATSLNMFSAPNHRAHLLEGIFPPNVQRSPAYPKYGTPVYGALPINYAQAPNVLGDPSYQYASGQSQSVRIMGLNAVGSFPNGSAASYYSQSPGSMFAANLQSSGYPYPSGGLTGAHVGLHGVVPKRMRFSQDSVHRLYAPTVPTSVRNVIKYSEYPPTGLQMSSRLFPPVQGFSRSFATSDTLAVASHPSVSWTFPSIVTGKLSSVDTMSVAGVNTPSLMGAHLSLPSQHAHLYTMKAGLTKPDDGLPSAFKPPLPNSEQLCSKNSEGLLISSVKNVADLSNNPNPISSTVFRHEPRKRKTQPVGGPLTSLMVNSLSTVGLDVDSQTSKLLLHMDPTDIKQSDSTSPSSKGSSVTSSVTELTQSQLIASSLSNSNFTLSKVSNSTTSATPVLSQTMLSQSSLITMSATIPSTIRCPNVSVGNSLRSKRLILPHTLKNSFGSMLPLRPRLPLIFPDRHFGLRRCSEFQPPVQTFYEPGGVISTPNFISSYCPNPFLSRPPPANSVVPHLISSNEEDSRTKLSENRQFYLVDPVFSLTAAEKFLWNRHFFGKSNPQQLIYTLIYLMSRILCLHSGPQLRYGIESQLKFVLLTGPNSAVIDQRVTRRNAYHGPISFINPNVFHEDYEHIIEQPQLRLLYMSNTHVSDLYWSNDTWNESESGASDTAPGSQRKQLVALSRENTSSEPVTRSTQRSKKETSKVGYLFGHFPANNHAYCFTCLHAFYLSKRPNARGSKEDAYFLAWHSNPSGQMWFRHRPIGANCLSEIFRNVVAALNWAQMAPNYSGPIPAELTSSYTLFDVVTSGDCPPVNIMKPDSNKNIVGHEDPLSTTPLNLVLRECNAVQGTQPLIQLSSARNAVQTHPVCLDYWPELTERARQSPWQCADCKTCSACHNRQFTTELLICDACDKGFHSECHVPKLQEPVDRSLPWVCAECQKEGYSVAIGTLPDSMTIPTSSNVNEDSITTTTNEVDNKLDQEIENETSILLEEASSVGNMTLTKEGDETRPSFPTPHTTGSHMVESELVRAPSVGHSEPANQPVLNPVVQNPSSVQLQSPHSLCTAESADSNPSPSNSEVTSLVKPVTTTHSPNMNQSNINLVQRNSSLSTLNRPWETDVCLPVACTPTIVRSTSNSTVDESQDTDGHGLHSLTEPVDTSHPQGVPEHLLRPDDVRAWSVDHVRDWLLEEGFSREAEAFSQQEIDGACLLLMKRMDVLTELGIKLGPAVKIYERIKRLQSRCTSPTVLGV